MHIKQRFDSGLTLTEVLLSTALFFTIVGLSTNLNLGIIDQSYQQSANEVLSDSLILARNNTLAGLNGSSWGVQSTGGSGELVVFSGASFAGRDITRDEVLLLPDEITADADVEFRFASPSGQIALPTTPHTFTFIKPTGSESVIINTYGLVE